MDEILNNPLFDAFADASDSVYIYVTDMKTGHTRWSQNAIDFFDIPKESFEDTPNVWPKKIHPDDLEMYMKDIKSVYEGVTDRHNCQYRAKNKFGKYVWVQCNGTMLYDKNGEKSVFGGMMIRLDKQSKYDETTGLPTKNEFYAADFSEFSGTVMLLGIDKFKRVINEFGYRYSEKLLAKIVKKLCSMLGSQYKVYYFLNDKFIIILPEYTKKQTFELFDKISSMAKNVETIDGNILDFSVSASAIELSDNTLDNDSIIDKLDMTLSYVKSNDRGNIRFYSETIEQKQVRLETVKKELNQSINNNFEGFELFYQPWINARGREILGCEALLRWKGKTIKNSYPMEFIPILEDNGKIIEVGRWVMETAMKQQSIWKKKYGDFKVSFNVSYRQFLEKGYVEHLLETSEKYGIENNDMVLELTESCKVDTPERLAEVFTEIRKNGFKIALDDFGTGYASMEMLKKLPADNIKIEHSFVREIALDGHTVDFAIIKSIINLCNMLKCRVVVEGVENKEVDDIIRGLKPDYLQGYYYSKPVCKSEFESMLEESNGRNTICV